MYSLTTEELRNLIQGKFRFRPCLDCGAKGSVLVDGDEGVVVQAVHPEKGAESYYTDVCDECKGLGGFLKFDE